MIQPKCTSAFPYWDNNPAQGYTDAPARQDKTLQWRIWIQQIKDSYSRTPKQWEHTDSDRMVLQGNMHRESIETHSPQMTRFSTFLTLVPAGREQPGLSPNLPPASTSLGKSPLSISNKHTCVCMVWKTTHKCICVYTQIPTRAHTGRNAYVQQARKTPPQPPKGDQEPHT